MERRIQKLAYKTLMTCLIAAIILFTLSIILTATHKLEGISTKISMIGAITLITSIYITLILIATEAARRKDKKLLMLTLIVLAITLTALIAGII